MKTKLLFSAVAMVAGSLLADTTPGDLITNAVTSLDAQPSYSWKTTVVVPDDSPFKPGPSTGKLVKGGYSDLTTTRGDATTEIISKGDAIAISSPDNGWQSAADLENAQGPGRFMVMQARSAKAPTAQILDLASAATALKQDGDVISGDLTEAGAKAQLAFRGRRGGGGGPGGPGGGAGPEVSGAKGSVKFWITGGNLTKFEYKVSGSMSFNGNDMAIDRDTTTEFTDIGTTKVTVPTEAQKILDAKPAAPAAN